MKDEIKEILDKLKSLDYDEYNLEVSMDYIERKEEKLLLDCITALQDRNKELVLENISLVLERNTYKSRNEKAIENIDLVIELIKQQPTGDDTWILNKLNGFKYLLQGEDKE